MNMKIQNSCKQHSRQITYLLTSFVLLTLIIIYFAFFPQPIFPIDDAYIILHSIKVLHSGVDYNYINVSPLIGITSLPHFALAFLFSLSMPPPWALMVTQWLAIILYGFGVVRLALDSRANTIQALLFLILSCTAVYISYQLLNGLETGLALAGIIWAFVFASKPDSRLNRILAPLLWGVLPFLRPELVILSALMILQRGLYYWRQQKNYRYLLHHLSRDVGLAVCSATPWVIWYYLSTGLPFPNSISAKEAYFSLFSLSPSYKLTILTEILHIAVITLGAGLFFFALLLVFTPLGRLGIIFIILFLLSYWWIQPEVLSSNGQRYLYVCFPIVLYGGMSCVQYPNKVIRIAVNCFLILGVIEALFLFPWRWQHLYIHSRNYTQTQLAPLTAWIQANLPPHAILLVHDAGYISYATDYQLVDMVGLKTPSITPYYKGLAKTPGDAMRYGKAMSEIIDHYHPDYIVERFDWEKAFQFVPQIKKYGYQFIPLHSEEKGYTVYKIEAEPQTK